MGVQLPTDAARLGAELSDAIVLFHEAVAGQSGLSAADHKALGIVTRRGPMSAKELASETGLTAGAVTGLVDRLEAFGWVRKERDSHDRRRVVIEATGQGRPGLARVFGDLSDAMATVTERYSAAEQAVIADWVVRTIGVMREQTERVAALGQ